jgi:cytochrome d ubiquinol oxidase subunit II
VLSKAKDVAQKLWLPTVAAILLLLIGTYLATDIVSKLGINPGVIPFSGITAILLAGFFLRKGRYGWSFAMTSLVILSALVTMFLYLYPRVMISSLNPDWSLTIYTAASSELTLRTMTIVALIFVPIVLAYQGWSYWIFRKRIEEKPERLTY